jgi:hypothetical protein
MADIDVNGLIAEHRNEVKLGEAVKILKSNIEFNLVFEQGLFKNRVQSLVLKLNTQNPTTLEYAESVRELDAISYLQNFLNQTLAKGESSENSIREAQAYLHYEGF